jgi:signal transduction histidine kinase
MTGFRSLYFKLFAVFGLTFLLLIVTLWAGVSGGFAQDRYHAFQKNLERYAALLAGQIGVPPDPARARALADDLDLTITWEAPGSPLLPRKERAVFRSTLQGWRFSFVPRGPFVTPNLEGLLLDLPVWAFILAASWWVMGRLLAPLRQMSTLAASFGVKDWKTRIPVKGKDDLATLAQTFNTMADRIEGYWNSQQALLAAVSHELRSPLTRMRVALEFVAEEKIRESLKEDILRLDRMTGILLERERLAQRPDLLVIEKTNFPIWLEEVVASYERLGLEIRRNGTPVLVAFDRSRMALVLSNLLENILKHAPGSPAFVRWRGPEPFVLCVEDHGPGLPAEARVHWGQPFRGNLDPRRAVREPGFGLGSSLVKSIVEAHGGTLALRESEPRGLTVEIRLP